MALNFNFQPLNFKEMRLREPQGARLVGEGIDSYKRDQARRRAERIEDERLATEKAERERKQALDNELADMMDIDKAIKDIDDEIQELERQNRELKAQVGQVSELTEMRLE